MVTVTTAEREEEEGAGDVHGSHVEDGFGYFV